MKQLFPQGVRVEIGRSASETKVIDIESGEIVSHIAGLAVEIDSNDRTHAPRLILVLCGVDMQVVANEGVEYDVPEDQLRRVAQQNGFDLVPIALEQKDLEPLGTAAPAQVAQSATAVGAPVSGRDKPADLGGDDVDELDASLTDEEDDEA